MTIDEIKELISVVNESGIAELEVTRGENRVRIRRSNAPAPQEYILSPQAATGSYSPAPHLVAQAEAAPTQSPTTAPAGTIADENTIYVKSPIVGTYYESGSPGAAPFVKVGDRISPGQVLCIIESMKLMNEIESEVSGTVISRLVENARPVEYGEALFAVQP